MPRVPADKTFFNFSRGLHTEASPLNFPEECSFDEENFELLTDGSRKRRPPLKYEVDGEAYEFLTEVASGKDAVTTYTWRNVGGDPDRTFIVIQVGPMLHFFENDPKLSTNKFGPEINLLNFLPEGSTRTASGIRRNTVSLTSGRGELFVSHPFLNSYRIKLVRPGSSTEELVPEPVQIEVREFQDIKDGIDLITRPKRLPDSHIYNLLNRGWKYGSEARGIYKYYNDTSEEPESRFYPSKNMVVWYGDIVTNPNGDEATNISYTGSKWKDLGNVVRDWNTEKIEKEFFGDTSAPKGALIINPFDTTIVKSSNIQYEIYDFGFEVRGNTTGPTPTDNVVWVEVDAIPATVGDDIRIFGTSADYVTNIAPLYTQYIGFWANKKILEKESVGGGRERIYYQWNWSPLYKFDPVPDKVVDYGYLAIEEFDNTINATKTFRRPRCNEFFASRMFYAGIQHPRWGDQIFFSQVLYDTEDSGKCYQNNDPTDPDLNFLVSDDGGTIQIPEVGDVKSLVAMDDTLIVLASHGVWAIRGRDGGFAADAFRVDKLSDVPSYSENGITQTDNTIMFTSPRGIYMIYRNEFGQLIVESLSEGTVQNLWDDLTDSQKKNAQFYYDDYNRRVHLLHTDESKINPTQYSVDLIFDIRLGSFFKYRFPNTQQDYIMGMAMLSSVDGLTRENKTKYLVISNSGQTLNFADYSDRSDWKDFNGEELIPYLITGYDNLGDFSRYRQAPIVHTFMRSTETAYDPDDIEGDSSLWMQARWNFANSDVSGKYGGVQQIYRRPRYYGSNTPNFDQGFEVISSRSKVRGRGKVLQLKFEGEENKDAHLLGWAIHYEGKRRP